MVQGCGTRWYSASLAQYWTFGESSTIQLDLSQQLVVNADGGDDDDDDADGGDDDHFQLSTTNCCAIYFYKFQLKYLSLKFEINFHVFLTPSQYSSSRKSTEMHSDHIPLNNDADSSDVLMIMTKKDKEEINCWQTYLLQQSIRSFNYCSVDSEWKTAN